MHDHTDIWTWMFLTAKKWELPKLNTDPLRNRLNVINLHSRILFNDKRKAILESSDRRPIMCDPMCMKHLVWEPAETSGLAWGGGERSSAEETGNAVSLWDGEKGADLVTWLGKKSPQEVGKLVFPINAFLYPDCHFFWRLGLAPGVRAVWHLKQNVDTDTGKIQNRSITLKAPQIDLL